MNRYIRWCLVLWILASGMAHAADPLTPAPGASAPNAAKMPDDRVIAARAVAEIWLQQIDAGKYGDSWSSTSTVFRSHEPKADWEKAISALRQPTGKVLSRTYQDGKVSENLPGAPPGQFASVRFVTKFSSAPTALESVTTVLESGQWRVTGYSVDDAPSK